MSKQNKNTQDQGTEWVAGAIVCIACLQYAGINVIGGTLSLAAQVMTSLLFMRPVMITAGVIGIGFHFVPEFTKKVLYLTWDQMSKAIGLTQHSNDNLDNSHHQDDTIKTAGDTSSDE